MYLYLNTILGVHVFKMQLNTHISSFRLFGFLLSSRFLASCDEGYFDESLQATQGFRSF